MNEHIEVELVVFRIVDFDLTAPTALGERAHISCHLNGTIVFEVVERHHTRDVRAHRLRTRIDSSFELGVERTLHAEPRWKRYVSRIEIQTHGAQLHVRPRTPAGN